MDLSSYQKHIWDSGMAITKTKMNEIETGIYNVTEGARSLNTTVEAMTNALGNNSYYGSYDSTNTIAKAIYQLRSDLDETTSAVSGIGTSYRQGQWAWAQIDNVTTKTIDGDEIIYTITLKDRFDTINGSLTSLQNQLGKVNNNPAFNANNTVLAAINSLKATLGKDGNGDYIFSTTDTVYKALTNIWDALGKDGGGAYLYDSTHTVGDALTNIREILGRDTNNSYAFNTTNTVAASIQTLRSEIVTARNGENSLNDRISPMETAIGNNTTDIDTLESIVGLTNNSNYINDLRTEVGNAHRNDVQNDTLVDRFEDIESDISDLESRISTGESNESTFVKYTDIYNGFDHTNTDQALSAAKGKELREMIGGSFTSSNTVASAITTAQTTAVTNANAYTDGELLNYNVSEINNAHRENVQDDTLDNRFDDIESTATQLRTDVDTIADELNMYTQATGAIAGTNSRIDQLETNMVTMANEIGMLQDGEAVVDMQSAISGATTRIDTIDEDLNTANTGIKARLDAIDNTSTGAIKALQDADDALDGRLDTIESDLNTATTGLKAKVSALEGKNTTYTEVVHSATYDTNGKPQINNPSENIDYLIKGADPDTKYYYWKYIKLSSSPDIYSWELISGASSNSGENSGTGNNNAEDYATYNAFDNATKEENKDYYVLQDDGVRHHYRYVTINDVLTKIEIGPLVSQIKKYRLDSGVESDVNYLYLHEFDYGDTDYEMTTNNRVSRIPLPSGGGIISAQKLTRIGTRAIIQPLGAESAVLLQFFYTSGIEGESGIGELFLDDTSIMNNIAINSGDPSDASTSWPDTTPLPTGFYSIDVSNYCTTLGVKHFQLIVRDPDDETLQKDLKWDVNVMNLTLTSTFTEHSTATLGSTVKFTYIANGDVNKVAHFKLNNTVLPTVSLSDNTSGEVQEYVIPAQSVAGTYRLEAWLTATVNGRELPPSKTITRDIIWYNASSNDVIISSKYRDNIDEPMTQYDTLEIPYTIVGGTTPYTVNYYVDDMSEPVNTVTLTGNAGVWEYRADNDGQHTLKIECQGQNITFTIDVTELNIDIAPYTTNLVLDFNPQGITNTSNKRLWTNGTYSMTVSNNFDWYNGGYGSDESGDYFLVKAGTSATFDYKMFTSSEVDNAIVNDVFETGKEFKLIFKTSAVRNADAVWFTNMGPISSSQNAKQVGIQLNAHNGFLKTDSASNVEVNGVAATNTYLYFPYSEEDKIELDININQVSENNNFIMSYEDGCPSKAYPYKTSEILYHIAGSEADITIGSNDCDVYIYRMRIYDSALTTEQVLRNFIADGKNSTECIDRYNRNSIYYDTRKQEFVPYVGNNTVLDPERLATKIPDVKVLMLEAPQFTKSKKDFIPYSSLRCIHAPGGKYFKSRGKEDNWLFQNGYHAGQGTTSDKYGNAGRNIDFLFMCDGIHNPSDKVSVKNENFLPGYQSSLILGYGTDEQQAPMYCLDWKDGDTWETNHVYTLDDLVRQNGEVYKCTTAHTSSNTFEEENWELQEGYTSKITLTSTSIPNNFFNLKVNIASSENANNALLQKRYNDFLLYSSPAHERDSRIKNDMEFVPAIIFIRETGANGAERREFTDDQWHFYALGNIGDSKKTDYTRAYDPDDMNEFTLEISDNNTNNSQFQSGVYNASFYRMVENPVIENINDYYVAGSATGTVEYNEETQYYGAFSKTIDTEINPEHTYYTFIESRRFLEPYEVEQDKDDDGKLKETFSALSLAGEAVQTTNYLFPINYATEWAVLDENNRPKNMRYWSLMNEKFDGDHSFEMRYACQGNYRDGKLVNDTHGKITPPGANEQMSRDKYQLELNQKVWQAFYTWLITSDNTQFINELDEWCVRSSVAFFYAFTHYYTMMDNRAKNTFWHFAKTGKHRRVSHPTESLLHIYEVADGEVTEDPQYAGVYNGTFVPTQDTAIIEGHVYYTQYAFDMWVYDCDTALGIDNNGELVFPYGKEDKDYRIDGDPSSSYVFNGAGSIFWCRLRDNFASDIRSIFTSVRAECFNADTLIDEFDKYQSCFPEAIWRLDVERKYIRSFTGDTGNGVFKTTKETRFLRDMMQGRKKYQRRQWAKDQDIYFGSKYMLPSVNGDFFEFSCYTPSGQAVNPNWNLTITPYQDMYINVSYAETFTNPIRAKAGVPYEVLNPMGSTAQNDSRIRVYGANHIQALEGQAIKNQSGEIIDAEGLASFYIKANNFENGKKLRKLILGTDNTSYSNGNFTTLNIANDYPILEILNIKNCGNLGGALDLSKSTALKTIEAQGTQITQVLLPASTGINVLHLPETITKLELKSAKQLTQITIKNRTGNTDMSHLTQVDINDSDYSNNINWVTMFSPIINQLDLISLTNLATSSIGNINELEIFEERKATINRVYLTGTLKVTGEWSLIEKQTYETLWSGLTLDTSNGTFKERYKVTYKYKDENGVTGNTIYTLYADKNATIIDPWSSGLLESKPSHDPTVSHIYQFGSEDQEVYLRLSGWAIQGETRSIRDMSPTPTIQDNTIIEAFFVLLPHEYSIKWYLKPAEEGEPEDKYLVKTSSNPVAYGEGYDQKAPTVLDIHAAGFNTASAKVNTTTNPVTATYSLFTGWEKLPTNINPAATDNSYDIYGVWESETKTLDEFFPSGLTNLTEKQLLILSAMPNKSLVNDRVVVGSRLSCTMGYEGLKSGTVLRNAPVRFDIGDPEPITYSDIKPLNSNNGFTLVIDYCFNTNYSYPSGKSAGVLAGCYHQQNNGATVNGFALYYDILNNSVKLGYGDLFNQSGQNITLSNTANSSRRNIIVLRRPATNDSLNNTKLYIYSSGNSSGALGNTINSTYINWNSALDADAVLNFGQLTTELNTSEYASINQIVDVGKGTIYWAKYWPEDLGAGECEQLAAWPHETINYAIQALNNGSTSDNRAGANSDPTASVILTTISGTNHGTTIESYDRSPSDGAEYGWDNYSNTRQMLNQHLVLGLPQKLQAILCKPTILTKRIKATVDPTFNQYNYNATSTTSPSKDYLYALSISNFPIDTQGVYINESNSGQLSWLNGGAVTAYTYDSTNQNWTVNADSENINYLNVRFPEIATPLNMRVFKGNSAISNFYTAVNRITGNIKRGDVFIDLVDNGMAYIYVDANDVRNNGIQIKPNNMNDKFTCPSGGWLPAEGYWLRTMSSGGSKASFMFVHYNGNVITNNQNTASSAGLIANYSLSI